MKKILAGCMGIVALFAITSSASAITCTIDQRPAATLLIPYFQATFNPDGTILGLPNPGALDTLVTIGNASSAPMLAHISVWSDRSELVLDFNIALTGFDIQGFSVASILRGFLPSTPVLGSGTHPVSSSDACQRNTSAALYPAPNGFLRERPPLGGTASPFDNNNATTLYPTGPFPGSFLFQVLDSLDETASGASKDSNLCLNPPGIDGAIINPIHGYITIDHANYCTLANPNDTGYWTQDAAGFENNLFGDYIYISGAGIGTMGFPAVAIEATTLVDAPLGTPGSLSDNTAAPSNPIGAACIPSATLSCPGKRTFYRRYVQTADLVGCANPMPAPQNAWDCGFGDQREPLGLKYAARWLDGSTPGSSGAGFTTNTSFFNVWRSSAGSAASFSGGLDSLLGPFISGTFRCTNIEPSVVLVFFDEDENTVTTNCPQSPCVPPPSVNFPRETQRNNILSSQFTHPSWPAGWVSMEFFNALGPIGGTLDQAWVTYDFQGPATFLSAGSNAAQLDPTTCQPLLVPCFTLSQPPFCFGPSPASPGVTITTPVVPMIVGSGP